MADKSDAFRLAVLYRAVASLSFVVGFGIATTGVVLGLGPAIGTYLSNVLQSNAMELAMDEANLPLTLVLGVIGVGIWQLGKSWAFYWTFSSALEQDPGAVAAGTSGDRGHDTAAPAVAAAPGSPGQAGGDATDEPAGDASADSSEPPGAPSPAGAPASSATGSSDRTTDDDGAPDPSA